MTREYKDFEDDGRVIADMSDLERQPLLMPRFGGDSSARSGNVRNAGSYGNTVNGTAGQQPVHIDRETRRAMIGGALSAFLIVGIVIAAAFAGIILLLGH